MPAGKPLTRIVLWAHELLAEVLADGDLAVDLTAGNGHDTLVLRRCVGSGGTVLAFDVQQQALSSTRERLEHAGIEAIWPGALDTSREPGVHLIHDSHARLKAYLQRPPTAVIANLGYLPGGDPTLITEPHTTLSALRQAHELLAPGGRIAVVVYPGHPGGAEEGRAVARLFSSLAPERWQVLRLEVANREQGPYLLVAEKR